MASLLVGAIVITYDTIAKALRRKRAAKADRDARFATLERDNAARITRLRAELCDCGGDHTAADHPGGPRVRDEVGEERVIRNDEGDGRGVYRVGTDEDPPAYEEVLASERGRGGREGYVR